MTSRNIHVEEEKEISNKVHVRKGLFTDEDFLERKLEMKDVKLYGMNSESNLKKVRGTIKVVPHLRDSKLS